MSKIKLKNTKTPYGSAPKNRRRDSRKNRTELLESEQQVIDGFNTYSRSAVKQNQNKPPTQIVHAIFTYHGQKITWQWNSVRLLFMLSPYKTEATDNVRRPFHISL